MAQAHELLNRVTVGKPLHYHNLTMFPLAWPETRESAFAMLGPAIERGEAVVEEVDEDGEVPNLHLTNHGACPLLIPEGEILVGAPEVKVLAT